ncbi:MAG: sigma-70 family RNA polymerase sigma factor [Bacteroidaceae bacterium]|jgi:RNA polymerase sigma-70 factor (ECF subfamily)|nr:sigma-70 family RNA polymerase sigma factor [Bacteroidaceae bacterium]MBQ6750370.1 sigma-70 family RNA polymerase sigma factor [Bacteroidaceae bacterium]
MMITAFERIVTDIRPRLLELCERFLANKQLPEEAEDMVQETLFRLWQMRERLEHYASPEALAVAIAKNVCIDLLRRQKAPTDTLHDTEKADTRGADQALIGQETERMIQSALSHLPATQRKMLTMKSEGMTLDEISIICGTTKQSTKTMISAARRSMAELFRKGGL